MKIILSKTRLLAYDVSCINCQELFGFSDQRAMFFVCKKCSVDIKAKEDSKNQ